MTLIRECPLDRPPRCPSDRLSHTARALGYTPRTYTPRSHVCHRGQALQPLVRDPHIHPERGERRGQLAPMVAGVLHTRVGEPPRTRCAAATLGGRAQGMGHTADTRRPFVCVFAGRSMMSRLPTSPWRTTLLSRCGCSASAGSLRRSLRRCRSAPAENSFLTLYVCVAGCFRAAQVCHLPAAHSGPLPDAPLPQGDGARQTAPSLSFVNPSRAGTAAATVALVTGRRGTLQANRGARFCCSARSSSALPTL